MQGNWEPALPTTPALDFLHIVDAKQRTAGLAIPLDDEEDGALQTLLRLCRTQRPTADMERLARDFLFTYRVREKHAPALDPDERAQLDDILEGHEPSREPRRRNSRLTRPTTRWKRWWMLPLIAVIVIAVGASVPLIRSLANPPATVPTVNVPPHQPAQQAPPANTELQNLREVFGTWKTVAPTLQRPQTARPAILLLNNGSYSASKVWMIPANSKSWQLDQSDAVDNVNVQGDFVSITDANGGPYIVGTDQAFVFADDPDSVYRIDGFGTVYYMPFTLAEHAARHIK